MKVLAWLYVVSIISGVIKVSNSYKNDGIESLALIVPCVICFWRAKRPESNKWLEFFGLLFTIATSGGIMSYITASYRSERETAVYLTLVFAGLTTLFYVLCERKISGKLISPKLSIIERSQSNVQQPVYQQPLNIQQPVLTTVTSPQSSTETKSQRPKLIGKEYKHESYYDRLKRLCTPSNFVDNYDKEKVDIANGIYAKIRNTNREDSDAKHALLVETEAK